VCQVFSAFGFVHKIATFEKASGYQVMVLLLLFFHVSSAVILCYLFFFAQDELILSKLCLFFLLVGVNSVF
jgi:hypothetical protein